MKNPSQRVEQLLAQLYSARTSSGRTNIVVAELMPFLRRYHWLVSEKFAIARRSFNRITLLEHFLNAKVEDVDAIKMLCNSLADNHLTEILETPGKNGCLPIHLACQNSSAAVVEFLISQQKPALMAVQDNFKQYPFTLAMANRKLPVTTLTKLLEMYPSAVATGITLSKAMMQDMPLPFLETVVKDWPSKKTRLNFRYCGTQPLSLAHTKILCKLFPKLKTLSLTTTEWEVPAFAYFVKKLQSDRSIINIEYLTLPSLAKESKKRCEEILNDFRLLLEANTSLRRLRGLVCQEEDPGLIQSWLQTIDSGIRDNRALKEFHFTNAEATICVSSKPEFYSASQQVDKNHGQQLGLCLCIWSFEGDEGEKDVLEPLLTQMVPTLTSFSALQFRSSSIASLRQEAVQKDLTKDIVALLKTNHAFQHILCVRYKVDLVAVCEALRHNTRLLSLEVSNGRDNQPTIVSPAAIAAGRTMLEDYNVTLKDFKPMGTASPKIQHYLDLNRLGRSIARSACINDEGDKLTKLIRNAQEDGALKENTTLQGISRAQSVVYGLLSEAPGSWCHGESDKKKRKIPPLG